MPTETMQTPVSHTECSREVSVVSPASRPRTMSDASIATSVSHPLGHGSPASSTAPTSPRMKVAVQRPSPQRNSNDQFTCDFSPECSNLVFNRKCEWSKHMDKHDRPYRCKDPQCAKLQGFTYSGGLLRHEREVHNKHGGPKEMLYCPFPSCKRHDGHGFTRKENLAEHIRRVHNKRPSDASIKEECVELTAQPSVPAESPGQASPTLSNKRKWSDPPTPEPSEGDRIELLSEIKRLRTENVHFREQMEMLRGELDAVKGSRITATVGFRSA